MVYSFVLSVFGDQARVYCDYCHFQTVTVSRHLMETFDWSECLAD